jgi:hypothetical protein
MDGSQCIIMNNDMAILKKTENEMKEGKKIQDGNKIMKMKIMK